MSESAGYKTWSKSRKVNDDNMSNSNPHGEPTAAGSSSNYHEDISPPPVQPQALESSATTCSNGIPAVRETSRSGRSKSSRASRLSREARLKRAQYEAELDRQRLTDEKVRARERVIQSRLELEMAEIEAEEAESEEDDELRHGAGTPAYSVEAWLKNTQPSVPVPSSPRPSLRASPPPPPVPALGSAPPTPPPPPVSTSRRRLNSHSHVICQRSATAARVLIC